MTSVRITAAGAVAFACLSFLTAPVSACDERYIKKCEKESAAVAAASEETPAAPAAKRKSAGRVQAVFSQHAKHVRAVKRTHAPGFAKRERGLTLASAESRMTTPETPLARRFRGFINPQPLAQNAFEALRKPHLVPDNLEPPLAGPAGAPATAAEEPAPPAAMELASADSKPVTLPELPAVTAKPVALASAGAVPAAAPPPAAPQAFATEAPPTIPAAPTGFPIHSLVLALCGALGAAGALRFIVGA
ncbi:MAG: hypothetical protein E6G97_06990 [Alphaproteobacteria bacterium]|nr:MAG: hypothetical protein E6G97_06990 [Alphaproteobacteria bacterium]